MNKEISNKSINLLVGKLKQERDYERYDLLFSELYEEVSRRWATEGGLRTLARKYELEESEVLSVALTKMDEAIRSFNDFSNNFYNYLAVSIRSKLLDVVNARKKDSVLDYVESFSTDDEISPDLLKHIPHANTEDEAIEYLQKTSEQRQLLTQLLEKADDKCRQAVEAFSKSNSFLEASKLLGIDDKTVKRRVMKVAKLYDPHVFGEIKDYFTVPTNSTEGNVRKVAQAS